MSTTMVHLNGHPVCAVDVETTGLQPGYHELVQVAILALDHTLQIDKSVIPFDILIRPQHLNRIEDDAKRKLHHVLPRALESGLDQEAAIDVFESWARTRLQLTEKYRIIPLGMNLSFDMAFIRRWLGFEHMSLYFDGRHRDVLTVANFMNDRANHAHEQIPFAGRMGLSRLAHRMGIEVDQDQLHDALYDCKIAAETYRKMLFEPMV